ncbi:MAG: hypothetical protein H0T62_01645 [Parachlamydiaceae bacterium]|nr:hypothetical protein [Parachlamydiaceae bacterium]
MQPIKFSLKEAENIVVMVVNHPGYDAYHRTFPKAPYKAHLSNLINDSYPLNVNDLYESESNLLKIYNIWIESLAKNLIELNASLLCLNFKLPNLKNIYQEQQVRDRIDKDLISELKSNEKLLLEKIENMIVEKNLILSESKPKDLLLQNAHNLIKVQQTLIEKQKTENTNLKCSMVQMNSSISFLKDEKLSIERKCANKFTNLKTNISMKKSEYERRIRELEVRNKKLKLFRLKPKSDSASYTTDGEG